MAGEPSRYRLRFSIAKCVLRFNVPFKKKSIDFLTTQQPCGPPHTADLLRLQEVGEFVYGSRYNSPSFAAADIFFDEVWYKSLVDALDGRFLGALTAHFYPLG